METMPLDGHEGHEEQMEDPKMNHEEGHGQEEQTEDPKMKHEEGDDQEEHTEDPKMNHEEDKMDANEARYTLAC